MRRFFLIAVLALCTGFVRTRGGDPTIYVSTSGNDSTGTGSLSQPYATPGKAQAVARTMLSGGLPVIDIVLRGGTYYLTSGLVLSASDNSEQWLSYPGETAHISGGSAIAGSGFSGPDGNGVYSISTGLTPVREIYINGVRYIRSHGAAYPSGWNISASPLVAPSSSGCSSSAVAGCSNPTQVEIDLQSSFTEAMCYVSSVAGANVTLVGHGTGGCDDNMRTVAAAVSGMKVYQVSNAFELLTTSNCSGGGCFFWNTATSTLYVLPVTGTNMATATVVVPQVVNILSGHAAASFAHLVFEHAAMTAFDNAQGFVTAFVNAICPASCTETHPDSFYLDMGAGLDFSGVGTCTGLVFYHDTFQHMGGRALRFQHGCQNFQVIASICTDIGGGCAELGDRYDGNVTTAGNQTCCFIFADNSITPSQQYFTTAELAAPFFRNSTIRNNSLDGSGDPVGFRYVPLHLGWGFLDSGGNVTTTSYNTGNTLTGNYVSTFCQESANALNDCGGWHNGGGAGMTGSQNYVLHGTTSMGGCMYTDNLTNNIDMDHNACDFVSTRWYFNNGGTSLTIDRNCTTNGTASAGPTNTVTYTSGSPPNNQPSPGPSCAAIIAGAGIEAGVTPGP